MSISVRVVGVLAAHERSVDACRHKVCRAHGVGRNLQGGWYGGEDLHSFTKQEGSSTSDECEFFVGGVALLLASICSVNFVPFRCWSLVAWAS